MRRRVEIALALVAVAAGLGLAFAVAGGDDDEPPSTGVPTVTTEETASTTETDRPEPPGRKRRRRQRDVREIEGVVTRLVEAVEQSDARGACAALVGGGSTLEACAEAAGVDLRALPTSDELSIDRIVVRGRRGTARLSSGAVLSLSRIGGRWQVSGLRPGAVAATG